MFYLLVFLLVELPFQCFRGNRHTNKRVEAWDANDKKCIYRG